MKRIVIIGPESTGKSTLCKALAKHYNTVWCPEYAREYLLKNGKNYSYDDLSIIAKGHLALQDELQTQAKNNLYFIDTDLYVMKVWHEVAFGKCPSWLLKTISKTHYDLYFLCDTDLPWEKDELREYPDLPFRQKLFKMYKDIVINSGVAWAVISGNNEERVITAINVINSFLNNNIRV